MQEEKPLEALQTTLIRYGACVLASQLGQTLLAQGELATWLAEGVDLPELAWARDQVGDRAPLDRPSSPGTLRSIFSLVAYDDERTRRPSPFTVPRRRLSLDLANSADEEAIVLWNAFSAKLARLRPGAGMFDSATSVIARYGWNVPGTLDLPGISVYEQFKAVSALAHILPPGQREVLLVEGDLSGIQDMLYTLSSVGAAKSLRGRSFYLQLLADAIVRTLLRGLNLPAVCVIFDAGGSFQLLARRTDEAHLDALRAAINRCLLSLHSGELALSMAWLPVRADDLADAAFAEMAARLSEQVEAQKTRAFAELARDTSTLAFGIVGTGSRAFCEICHVDLPDADALRDRDRADDEPKRCDQCDSFGDRPQRGGKGLAYLVAQTLDHPVISVEDLYKGSKSLPGTPDPSSWRGKPAWDVALAAFGFSYRFAREAHAGPYVTRYTVNDSDCLPDMVDGACRYSFRFLANTAPRIEHDTAQVRRLNAFLNQHRPRRYQEAPEEEREVQPGAIRSMTLMARWDSHGVDRYGVLRMDVDDLGALFRRRLDPPTMLHTSALSGALSLFFEGWLNRTGEMAAASWQERVAAITDETAWRKRVSQMSDVPDEPGRPLRSKTPYIIYAGGDDLLMVGPWDVLPAIARQIRRDLGSLATCGFVDIQSDIGESPLTMSAGIFSEAEFFPLYQAADQAGVALRAAKRRKGRRRAQGEERLQVVKDAVTMLETTVSWHEFATAADLAERLAEMLDVSVEDGPGRRVTAPRALLQLLAEVADIYTAEGGDAPDGRLAYGRWMPLLAYGLRRMSDRVPQRYPKLRQTILGLAGDALDLTRVAGAAQWHTMRFLNLPVRWAEFLIRNGG
jgi:CRISPR-associated protein Csm1